MVIDIHQISILDLCFGILNIFGEENSNWCSSFNDDKWINIAIFIEKFADIIYKAGYASPIRTPRGEDIMAACGQLKSATERARKSRKQIEAEAGLAQQEKHNP